MGRREVLQREGIETTVLTFSLDKSALYDYKPAKLEVIKAEPFYYHD